MRRILTDFPVCLVAALSIVLATMSQSFGHWDVRTSGISAEQVAEYHDWFVTQLQERDSVESKPTPCCGDEEHYGGDGRYVDVRSVGDGKYEVFVTELARWVLYPKPVNPGYPNPTGRNVAWLYIYATPDGQGGKTQHVTWFCLRLAQGM